MIEWLNSSTAVGGFSIAALVFILESILSMRRKKVFNKLNNRLVQLPTIENSNKTIEAIKVRKENEFNDEIFKGIFLDYFILNIGILFGIVTIVITVFVLILNIGIYYHIGALIIARIWIKSSYVRIKELADEKTVANTQ